MASNLQKRLLRYALAQLDIFDTDVFDLEKLDISWGQQNVFNFRDVPLQVKKLSGYMSLPSSIQLDKARVKQVQITIPANIFSRPIVVEVDGVDIRLVTAPDETNPTSRTPTRRSSTSQSPDVVLPSAQDLATSFLHDQSDAEKLRLRAELKRESQRSRHLPKVHDDQDDGEYGTGMVPINIVPDVPGYLASFLRGILDRLQVKISNVTFEVVVNLPTEDRLSILSPAHDTVTLQISVEDLEVEGVTPINHSSTQSNLPLQKPGKRLVNFTKLRGQLISDASIFAHLARSSAVVSSPSVAHSSVSTSPRKPWGLTRQSSTSTDGSNNDDSALAASTLLPPRPSSSHDASIEDGVEMSRSNLLQTRHDSEHESILENSILFEPTSHKYLPNNILMPHSSMYSSESESPSRSPLVTPRATSQRFESQDDHGYFHDAFTAPESPEQLTQHTTLLPERPRNRYAYERVSRSQPTLPRRGSGSSNRGDSRPSPSEPLDDTPDDTTPVASPLDTPLAEDALAQSSYFSHEDAESMYMSALSSDDPNASLSHHETMPGAWAESVYDFQPPATPSTDIHDIPRQASHDNLQHALHEQIASENENSNKKKRQPSSSGISVSTDASRSLAKQLFILNHINLYIPSTAKKVVEAIPAKHTNNKIKTVEEPDYLADSINLNVPGDYSSHDRKSSEPGCIETVDNQDAVELNIGHLDVQFDIAVGRLMTRVIMKLLQLLGKSPSKTPKSGARPDNTSTPFHCHAQDISVKFLERLMGRMMDDDTADGEVWNSTPASTVLLQTSFKGLQISSTTVESVKATDIMLDKFLFGYSDESIINFDETLYTHTSSKDLRGKDVHVVLKQTAGVTKCQVKTLPLHIVIDLQKLDETFSWFGGLSGVLNMGSSMASTIITPTSTLTKAKARSVRFNTPKKPSNKSTPASSKFLGRIGGIVLDLIGKDCSIGVETSAVKVMDEADIISAGIDKITIAGPHLLRKMNEQPAIVVALLGTKLQFLNSPDEEADLNKLVALITPSKNPYDKKDNIMIDTLLRQRRQGSVLRATISDLQIKISKLDRLSYLPALSDELARLASVTKYLPEDDRPGLLSLITVHETTVQVDLENSIGKLKLQVEEIEVAQISLPSLIATRIKTMRLFRNDTEELVGSVISSPNGEHVAREPVVMARMIGNEMEPKIMLQIEGLRLEYHVSTIMDILSMSASTTSEELVASMTASVATLTDHVTTAARNLSPQKVSNPNPLRLDVVMRDCAVGLNPLHMPAKILVVLTRASMSATMPKDEKVDISVDLSKGTILVTDNNTNSTPSHRPSFSRRHSYDGGSTQTNDFCGMGYVPVTTISSAGVIVHMFPDKPNFADNMCMDVEIRSDLLVIESCADSTQTLIAALSALTPPTPPSTAERYRTSVMPIQDLLASLSSDAFTTSDGTGIFEEDFPNAVMEDNIEDSIMIESQYISHKATVEKIDNRDEEELLGREEFTMFDQEEGNNDSMQSADDNYLDFADDHFGDGLNATTERWSSAKNNYVKTKAKPTRRSPLRVRIRDVHVIWNLFDGYDWQDTRDTITKAVHAVEMKAFERNHGRSDRERMLEMETEDDNAVIGDCLFNSIYISIPANGRPGDLAMAINHDLNDTATETESVANTALSSASRRPTSGVAGLGGKRLRLKRSKRNKITFELQGVNVDFVANPPDSGETQNSVNVRIRDLDVFDRVPTSTWKKFATYMHDAGERESGADQVHIEMLTVKPISDLAASEIVMRVTVLPLRLHVDQDALDFITRFFEFKSDSVAPSTAPSDSPFLQRVEVNAIQVRLDFKPKRVDYKSLRSGRTTEFMNFVVLDKADMVMRHCILYGISGFENLGKALNDIWMPDIKRNQLPGILAGLAPLRPVVDVLSGFRTLVTVPQQEIRRDGRLWKGIGKGVRAFTGETGLELLKAGAKLTTGTGAVLGGIETYISGPSTSSRQAGTEDEFRGEDSDESDEGFYSAYANQPLSVTQGMRSAVEQIKKDFRIANGALIAMPGAFAEKGTVGGALGAVRDYAPMIILRPFAGIAKGTGQALMGAVNSLDPNNSRQVHDKYKSSS